MSKDSYSLSQAQKLLQEEPLEKVSDYAKRWLRSSPDSLDALQFCGMISIKKNNPHEALEYFKHAILQKPKEISCHINLSNIYTNLGRIEEALMHLRQALRLQPLHAEAYNNIGRLLYKQKRFEEAIPNFEKALRIDPDYWEAHYNLAHSLASQNQLSRAATHYREVIRLFPEHPIAHFNLGLVCIDDENYTEAEKHLSKALELNEHNDEAAKQLGQAYVMLGKTNDALQAYEKALRLTPNQPDLHHNIAILHLRNEDKAKALFHFKEALKLDPRNDTAKHMVMALNSIQTATTAPLSYLTQLFDQYADYYNDHLKNKLKYQVPYLLRNAIGKGLGSNPKAGRILDLGCGTGLCGIFFRDLALELIGVDLSSKMIEKAKALDAYEKLLVADLNEYLSQDNLEPFDLIIAGDVLVYSGDLHSIFKNVARALVLYGQFAFTTEHIESDNYYLQPTGRFAHSTQYIHQLTKEYHFTIEIEETITPREHEGIPVPGQLYILKKIESSS